jgi:hypothetical protein
MAEESENVKSALKAEAPRSGGRSALKESEVDRPGLEKYALPGPWTQADEEWFRWTTEMFGGAAERDPDL